MRRAVGPHRGPSRPTLSPTFRIRRVLDALAPRHLGDVDEAFDAGLEFHESAVSVRLTTCFAHARHRVAPMTLAHGSVMSCLWPSDTRSVAASHFRTMTSICH